jgi:mycoredoxin
MFDEQMTDLRSSKGNSAPSVEVYGTNWCAATQMVRRTLDRLGVAHIYHNMDDDPAAAKQVQWWTGGYLSHPTVQIGGNVLVEPSLDELRVTLRRLGVI